jgi:hypothetical protein
MECCTDQEWKGNWDPFVRLCFQFGMLLGVDEFQQDLGFHLCKHRLGQRLGRGWGLVWGTGIVDPIAYDPDPAKKDAHLTVGPLFAIDELGRELWVKAPCTIDLFKWAQDSALPDDTPIYVTIAYRACCVAPVPAVAAPCDDSASATMPSRVLETVECELSLDPPEEPIDLSDAAPTPSDTLPIRFQTLVDLIRNDARRPLLLGSVTRKTIAGGKLQWTVAPNPRLPRVTSAGGEALRVVEASVAGSALLVIFSRPPSYAPSAAFQVYQLAPGSPPALTQLVAAGATVTPDATDPRKLSIGLTAAPAAGYRIEIAGTGPSAVLFATAAGLAPLNEGRNYTRWGTP